MTRSYITLDGVSYYYTPVTPCADTGNEALGCRLILQHGGVSRETALVVARPGLLTAGWVVGVDVVSC